MKNTSQITSSGFGSERGGSIKINAPQGFIVAAPYGNNDISSASYTGLGGNVSISSTTKLLGIQRSNLNFREANTSPTNDITSVSDTDAGFLSAPQSLVLDPNRGLARISEEIPRVSILEGCQVNAGNEPVRFYNIGFGGKPPELGDPGTSDTYGLRWISLRLESFNALNQPNINPDEISKFSIESTKNTLHNISLCQR